MAATTGLAFRRTVCRFFGGAHVPGFATRTTPRQNGADRRWRRRIVRRLRSLPALVGAGTARPVAATRRTGPAHGWRVAAESARWPIATLCRKSGVEGTREVGRV